MKNYDGINKRGNGYRAYNRLWGGSFGARGVLQLRAERAGKKSVRFNARMEDLNTLNELFEVEYEEYDYGDY